MVTPATASLAEGIMFGACVGEELQMSSSFITRRQPGQFVLIQLSHQLRGTRGPISHVHIDITKILKIKYPIIINNLAG